MPARKAIEAEYTTDNGIIMNPGKFQGEPVYVVDFYEAMQDGCGEDTQDGYISFPITDEDKQQYPELIPYSTIEISEDEMGFLHHRLFG
jgi:hypothetical protein